MLHVPLKRHERSTRFCSPQVHELLEVQNVGANNANDRGVRPMHMACQTGNMALVQRLLELGKETRVVPESLESTCHTVSA